jgi:hypothetical protein
MPNPYVQVALTYVRRPFSSWRGWLISVVFCFMFFPLFLPSRGWSHQAFGPSQLMPLVFLFACLAVHAKGQFADSRARLTPGFRRVHAAVAAVAALVFAVLLPAVLAHVLGQDLIGLVAVVLLLYAAVLWVIVTGTTWTCFAMVAGFIALFGTEPGRAWFRELVSGQREPQAAALLALGALTTLLAGVRLVRLNEDMPGFHTELQWNWDWSKMTRQQRRGDGRFLPGLRDWIAERQMARLTRLARQAPASRWSRICRWQVGMAAGWSLWFWIFGTLIYVHFLVWWISTRTGKAAAPEIGAAREIGMASFVLTLMPTVAAIGGVFQWRNFNGGQTLLLPVERKTYIRQLGAAAALSHFQLWAGMSVALLLWLLLLGAGPLQPAMLAGVLAFSAAFQVVVFGAAVWTARYRSRALGGLVLGLLFAATQPMQWWLVSSRGQFPCEVAWIAGIAAALGLLITLDAYRRWLAADFD